MKATDTILFKLSLIARIKESNFITTNKRITFLAEAVPFASQKQNGGSKLNKKENRKKTPEKQIKNIEKKKKTEKKGKQIQFD